MRRTLLIAGLIFLVCAFAGFDYAGFRSLKEMRADLHSLEQEVAEASKLAQEESASAAAATHRAEEAARRAEVAAEGRQQAESGRAAAEAAAQQANNQAQQANTEAQKAQDQVTAMRREREAELNRMQEALNRVVETHRTPQGMLIVLPNSVFRFDFDRADLNAHNRELLSRIAGILLVSNGYGLSVFGYTDDVGTAEYNQQLSLRRAKAVQDYLVQSGIDPAIINVKGFGKTSPRVNGTNAGQRAENRRVEIALTDSSIRFGDDTAPVR